MKVEVDMSGQSCPSGSELSAWVDGEGRPEIGEHLDRCPECRQAVEFYNSVDDTLLLGQTPPSDDLAERIFDKCLTQGSNPRMFPGLPNTPYLKVAAVLVIITAGALGINYFGASSQGDGQADGEGRQQMQMAADGVTEAGSASFTGGGNTGVNLPGGRRNTANENSPVQFVRLISGYSTPSFNFDTPASTVLPQSVRHIWVVDDLQQARREFTESLPAGSGEMCAATSNKAFCFRVVLADHQVQQLVNTLGSKGWALVSPELPQPGEIERLRVIDRKVTYVAEVVAK